MERLRGSQRKFQSLFVSLRRMTFAFRLSLDVPNIFRMQIGLNMRYFRVIVPIASAYNWRLHHCWHLLYRPINSIQNKCYSLRRRTYTNDLVDCQAARHRYLCPGAGSNPVSRRKPTRRAVDRCPSRFKT